LNKVFCAPQLHNFAVFVGNKSLSILPIPIISPLSPRGENVWITHARCGDRFAALLEDRQQARTPALPKLGKPVLYLTLLQ